jgi:hypothetical protein
MTNRKQIKVYLVQRLCWQYGDDFYYRHSENDAPMKTFLDRASAEAHRRECQWQYVVAEKINPFGYTDLAPEERTSRPMDEFRALLDELGLDSDGDWWQEYDALADEQKRQVWDAVDRFRFFEVVEMVVDLDQ